MKKGTREKILQEGAKIVHLKGYNNTGLQEILNAANVPKGSFYFYFKNKQDFGLQLIDFYADFIKEKWDSFYRQSEESPIQRLKQFFKWFLTMNEKADYKGGCPLGNLSQELADTLDVFQDKLNQTFIELKGKIRSYLKDAQDLGEIGKDLDIDDVSDLIFSCFQGALIQMKVARNSKSMEVFYNMLFELLSKKL